MANTRHILVYVVDRPDDPFLGIRTAVAGIDGHECVDVRLLPANYEIVRQVEYSGRKNFRFFYYAPVFRELTERLRHALADAGTRECIVYFSDEGVWAEFLREFRARQPFRFLAVNVQHGFEHHTRPSSLPVRRFANLVSTVTWGYPAFGLGCFGGSGPGVFDLYLTYDGATSKFVREFTGDCAVECPRLIKHRLFTRYAEALRRQNGAARDSVLFAIQPRVAGLLSRANINVKLPELLEDLAPLARQVVETHARPFRMRRHPGMDEKEFTAAFAASSLSKWATLDEHADIAASLAVSSVVMSFDSTVLWEASLLGLVPVSVQGRFFNRPVPFRHELLVMQPGFESRLAEVLSETTAAAFSTIYQQSEPAFASILEMLAKRDRRQFREACRSEVGVPS